MPTRRSNPTIAAATLLGLWLCYAAFPAGPLALTSTRGKWRPRPDASPPWSGARDGRRR